MIVVAIVAHADDETLGAGATLRKHADAEDTVYGIYLTDGVGARAQGVPPDAAARRRAATDAAGLLGMEWIARGGFPDNAMDTVGTPEVAQFIETAVRDRLTGGAVRAYTHWPHDLNQDHVKTAAAVAAAFRPQPGRPVAEICAMEVASSTEWGGRPFLPSMYSVIDEGQWEAKRRALHAYAEEMRDHPHARSLDAVEARAKVRGCEVGAPMAEAFCVVRRIER